VDLGKKSIGVVLATGLVLVGCETTNPKENIDVNLPMASLNAKREVSPVVAQAFQLLKEKKYREASQFINQALQAQPKSVIFHVLNGVAYEKLAETGDASGTELASIGYQNAINLDPSNSFALIQLGKLKYREQIYDQAQQHFANALLIKPNDADLWHELAAASYYAYDAQTALSAIDRASKLKPEDPRIHRSATMIYASLGDFKTAKKHLDIFQVKAGNDPAVDYVVARYNDWESLYNSGRITLAAATTPTPLSPITPSTSSSSASAPSAGSSSASTPSSGSSSTSTPSASSSASASSGGGGGGGGSSGDQSSDGGGAVSPGDASEAQDVLNMSLATPDDGSTPAPGEAPSAHGPQVVIDCYLLRITEDAITSKGNNILENLAVTFNPGGFSKFKGSMWGSGAPSSTSPNSFENTNVTAVADSGFNANQQSVTGGAAAAFTPAQTTLNLFNSGSVSGQVFAAGITWAGLTYSLNIANAVDMRTEVVSRPSLTTFLNKPSVFFSGEELINGFTGQYGGTLVKYPVGVTLEVTPESLEGDLVTLQIGIEGSLLTAPDPNLAQTVQVAKTRVDTYAKIRLGETLILGGLYERIDLSSKNGFPGLQEVPVIQYFFSNESTLSDRKSIVFMLTPRSPDAVKSAVMRAMSRQAVEGHLSELVSRTPDWFSTRTNMEAIFSYLATDPIIYYEFRSGDILPPSWGWEPTLEDKLRTVAGFLYF
jgi:Flp pilus assembly protein TadD